VVLTRAPRDWAADEGLDRWQPPKVLRYDAVKLFNKFTAWKALFSASYSATAMRGLGYRVAGFCLVALCFVLLAPTSGAASQASLDSLNSGISTGLFFILGSPRPSHTAAVQSRSMPIDAAPFRTHPTVSETAPDRCRSLPHAPHVAETARE
jgi:hypothetical protein